MTEATTIETILADGDLEIILKKVTASILHRLGIAVSPAFIASEKLPNSEISAVSDAQGSQSLQDSEGPNEADKTVLDIVDFGFQKLPYAKKCKSLKIDVPEVQLKDEATILYSLLLSTRNDLIDTPLLRYIVARKKHPEKAAEMCIHSLKWRVLDHPVDQYVFDGDAKFYVNHEKDQFVNAFRLNQVYLRGSDLNGRPVVVIEVQKHLRHNCPDHDFQRFICLVIEWVRFKFVESKGINKGSILFDMTGFGLQNADLHAVKFLVGAFEANYPEYLGAVLIHKAPWVFNAVWRIIKGWLDPAIAEKIHFTYNAKELGYFIDPKWIPSRLGGEDTYEMKYIEPSMNDLLPKKPGSKFEHLVDERRQLFKRFFAATIQWLEAASPELSLRFLLHRFDLQKQLARNYILLDPYIRTKGVFDRCGEIAAIQI